MKKLILIVSALFLWNNASLPTPSPSLWTSGIGLLGDSAIPVITASAGLLGAYFGLTSNEYPCWENLLYAFDYAAGQNTEQKRAQQALAYMQDSMIGEAVLSWYQIQITEHFLLPIDRIKQVYAQFRRIQKIKKALLYGAVSTGCAAAISWPYSKEGARWIVTTLLGSWSVTTFIKNNATDETKKSEDIISDLTKYITHPHTNKNEYWYENMDDELTLLRKKLSSHNFIHIKSVQLLVSLRQKLLNAAHIQKNIAAPELETTEKLLAQTNSQIGTLVASEQFKRESGDLWMLRRLQRATAMQTLHTEKLSQVTITYRYRNLL